MAGNPQTTTASVQASGEDPLLSVSDLTVHFDTPEGRVQAVDGVSFEVQRDEAMCLVGESGSGKTVTCEVITKLLDSKRAEIEGTIEFDGTDLTALSTRKLRKFRGDRIGHVFQNPQGALDPVYTVGRQVREAVRNASDRSKSEARKRAIELLDRVGLPDPVARADDYPHELSGGMKQRVTIAIALAGDPDLLIADEPTTALDVTIEASIVKLLSDLQQETGTSLLYVTHDLGIVAELADRVTVMYAGKVMESGDVFETFERPAHPYTQALLRCRPGQGTTDPIEGAPPDPRNPPDGCRFHPRCPHAVEECTTGDQPPLYEVEDGTNQASCVYYGGYHEAATIRDAWRSADGAGGDARSGGAGGDSTTGGASGADSSTGSADERSADAGGEAPSEGSRVADEGGSPGSDSGAPRGPDSEPSRDSEDRSAIDDASDGVDGTGDGSGADWEPVPEADDADRSNGHREDAEAGDGDASDSSADRRDGDR